jgi:hypothetical protein
MWSLSNKVRKFRKAFRLQHSFKELQERIVSFDPSRQKPHGLPKPLVVSLTSYPARFGTLSLTLNSILTQTVRPDKVLLWISENDKDQVPPDVMELNNGLIDIRFCRDFGSFKKIIPTIENFSDCFTITFDDDVYYWSTCIDELISGYVCDHSDIVCHRAHYITVSRSGIPRQYKDWESNIRFDSASPYHFPCGVLGVLYAPGIFHEDVCNESIFSDLCPTADDVWLYWMWRMTGHCSRKVGKKKLIVEWPATQSTRLRQHNIGNGGNDKCITNLIERYGFPSF